jgi:hypothetical protein
VDATASHHVMGTAVSSPHPDMADRSIDGTDTAHSSRASRARMARAAWTPEEALGADECRPRVAAGARLALVALTLVKLTALHVVTAPRRDSHHRSQETRLLRVWGRSRSTQASAAFWY